MSTGIESGGVDSAGDIEAMMERIRWQQAEVERVQRDVEVMLVKGYSRGNEVSATVQGTGKFTEIAIDPEIIRGYDAFEVGSIVLEAVNDALDRLSVATAARYAPVIESAGQ